MISIEDIKEQTATAERKAREAKAEYEFAKRHPELNCVANFQILRTVHDGVEMTLKSLEDLIQHPPIKRLLAVKNQQQIFNDELRNQQEEKAAAERARQKVAAAEATEREQLWNQISQLLKVSPMMAEGEHKRYLLKNPTNGEWVCPTSVIRQRLQTLKETSVFRGSTTRQIKEYLRGTQPKKSTGYPPLPADISATQIRLMWDATQLRNGIKKYGAAAITQRLQEGENAN
jgi:hypothetical protein